MPNLTQYMNSANETVLDGSPFWVDQSMAYGQNDLLDRSSYLNESLNNYVTNLFDAYFSYNESNLFFQSNLGAEISKIVYCVKYRISTPNEESSNSELRLFLSNSSGNINITPDAIENLYRTTTNEIKTAEFTFDSTLQGCPSVPQVNDNGFRASFVFLASNPSEVNMLIEIYEIKQSIFLSSVLGPNIRISLIENNKEEIIINNKLIKFGSYLTGSKFSKTYNIENIGNLDLTINSIKFTENISFLDEYEFPTVINPTQSIQIVIIYDVPQSVDFNEDIRISNNSIENSSFLIRFEYSGEESSLNFSNLQVYSNSIRILNNKISSLSSMPFNILKILTAKIFNYGSSNLLINSISVSRDGSIWSGTDIFSGSIIEPNSYKTLNIFANNFSLGNKQINITITSNDSQNNPFNFYFTYSVLPQVNVFLTSGIETLVDGSVFALGSLDKGKSSIKSYILKNDGVYKTIIINSILTNKDIFLSGSYNFPFILMPNSANSLVFIIGFNTNNSGLKDGSFTINYDEGSVP